MELTTSGQPAEVDIVILYLVRVDKEEYLLCLLKVPCCRLRLSIIKIEDIVIEEVTLDGVEVDENIFKLPQEKETRGHALPTWYSI